MIKKILLIILGLSIHLSAYAQATCQGEKLYYLNMPIILGTKIFNDQVAICKDKGKLQGELSVPKRFKAKLENIKLEGKDLSFSITANEGRGPFQVFYSGEFKENNKFFMGLAHLKDKKLLGPFIGIVTPGPQKLEVIQ